MDLEDYTDDMPDCDDYDNWGEFMDDWEGNMPDGSASPGMYFRSAP